MYKKPNLKKLQADCDAFNAKCAVGGDVDVILDGAKTPVRTKTRSQAQVMGGHSAVIWLACVSGSYLLDRVTPIAA